MSKIAEMFAHRSIPSIFHTYFSDSVDVIIIGQDFHLGDLFNSLQAFHNDVLERNLSEFKEDTFHPIQDGGLWLRTDNNATKLVRHLDVVLRQESEGAGQLNRSKLLSARLAYDEGSCLTR